MIKQITKKEAIDLALEIDLPYGKPLSFSQIQTYQGCPRAYFYQYVKRIPRPDFHPMMSFGSVGHLGLETLLKQKRDGHPIDMDRVSRAIYTGFSRIISKAPERTPTTVSLHQRQLECIVRLVERFAYDFLPEINPTGIEQKKYFNVNGVPLVVIIDLVDNNSKVTDFKFSKRHKSDKDAKDSLQLSIYGMTEDIRSTSFISLKFPDPAKLSKWKPDIKESVAIKKPGDLKWAEKIVGVISESIIAGAYPYCDPSNWKCSPDFCDAWDLCRGKVVGPETKPPSWIKGR